MRSPHTLVQPEPSAASSSSRFAAEGEVGVFDQRARETIQQPVGSGVKPDSCRWLRFGTGVGIETGRPAIAHACAAHYLLPDVLRGARECLHALTTTARSHTHTHKAAAASRETIAPPRITHSLTARTHATTTAPAGCGAGRAESQALPTRQ